MLTFEAIKNRRTVRRFKEDDIPEKDIELMLEAAMSAPSYFDARANEYYVIKNKEDRELVKSNLDLAKYDSPVILIFCYDTKKKSAIKISPVVEALQRKHDIYLSLENLLLAATDLGYGASIDLFDFEKAKALNKKWKIEKGNLLFEDGHFPLLAVFLGRPFVEDGCPKDKFDKNKIHYIK